MPADLPAIQSAVLSWYAVHGRDLPWRRPDCSPWGVYVSEIMAQQTPIPRVLGPWQEWMARWPTPAALAAEPAGAAIAAWGRLGYPRRALRLHQAATAMVERHGGGVPRTEVELRALPGVGDYTAAAVAAFAFGERSVVLDTNVRRVLARLLRGEALAPVSPTRAERDLAASVVPTEPARAATWNVAAMELGALVCTARAPSCPQCPVQEWCAWHRAGRPAYQGPPRRGQGYQGTDRKLRGDLVQRLRDATGPVGRAALSVLDADPRRIDRLLDDLVAEGLIEPVSTGFVLPGRATI